MKRNGNAPCSTTSQSGLRPPAPLVGEPLARRQSLQNAKASPTRRGVTAGDGEVVRRKAFRKPQSKTETYHVVQPLSQRLRPPAPLGGEPLARRRSLRNAKASPTRRGVTAGDGEVVRRKAFRKPQSKTETYHVVQPLSQRLRPPAPLVGEPLARRRSLRNAKASPGRRGVTEGDGEVVRRMRFRKQ